MLPKQEILCQSIDTPQVFRDEKVHRTANICIESWSKCFKGAAHRPHLLKIRFNANGALHL
ncbi:MAG: hypothetical protein AAF960_29975 [Bacteroidota bacterium]